jgi:hypothetical protein
MGHEDEIDLLPLAVSDHRVGGGPVELGNRADPIRRDGGTTRSVVDDDVAIRAREQIGEGVSSSGVVDE